MFAIFFQCLHISEVPQAQRYMNLVNLFLDDVWVENILTCDLSKGCLKTQYCGHLLNDKNKINVKGMCWNGGREGRAMSGRGLLMAKTPSNSKDVPLEGVTSVKVFHETQCS